MAVSLGHAAAGRYRFRVDASATADAAHAQGRRRGNHRPIRPTLAPRRRPYGLGAVDWRARFALAQQQRGRGPNRATNSVLQEWVPEGDLAHFVSDLVESALDLSPIYAAYEEERGYPPYDPRLMLKLLIYGYAGGVASSRKLEAATYRNVAVRMLCAGQHPDHRSIARFRKRHLEALSGLFVRALRLCKQARMVGLGTLALTDAETPPTRPGYEGMVFVAGILQTNAAVCVPREDQRLSR